MSVLDISTYRLPVIVTAICIILWYYLLLVHQATVKHRLKNEYASNGQTFDRYNSDDPRMLAADRIVGNFLEQTWPFLASMWIYCLFVNITVGVQS
eukprot:310911_1